MLLINVKGGRNTGIKAACGDYVVFIDCDDCFADGALLKLAALLRENMILDVVMYDFQSIDVAHDNKLSSGCYVSRNSSEMMDGTAFLKSQ